MTSMEVCDRSSPMAMGLIGTNVGEAVPTAKRKELSSIKIKVCCRKMASSTAMRC